MQILIEIDEERYKDIQRIAEVQMQRRMPTVEQIIANGIPLPKGHGKLKDTDAIYNRISILNRGENKGKYTGVLSIITCANVIVEADKEEKDG